MTNPVVVALDGGVHDWAWLRAKYGDVDVIAAAEYPKFELVKVEELDGQAVLMVHLLNEYGIPHSGQPVCLSWPSLAAPSPNIPAIPAGSKSCYTTRGVIQKTENGQTGFGLSGGSYYSPPGGGPYSVFVLSPSTYSDCITGVGWLGGTNHLGPCRLTFQIVTAGAQPDPNPDPQPDPVPSGDVLAVLTRIADALEKLAAHLGVR